MSLPGWQVHVVPSLAPHPPQGCPGSSCPSPRGFVTTPGLQEEGSLPQPTPALGSQKEPKATQKPATNPTAAAPLWNRASTSHSSQIPGAKQRKTSKAKTSLIPQPGNAPAGGRRGGARGAGTAGKGRQEGGGITSGWCCIATGAPARTRRRRVPGFVLQNIPELAQGQEKTPETPLRSPDPVRQQDLGSGGCRGEGGAGRLQARPPAPAASPTACSPGLFGFPSGISS